VKDVQLPDRHGTSIRTSGTVPQPGELRTRDGLAELCDRLGARCPEVDPAIVEGLVQEAWEERSRDRVKGFRMVLVERTVLARIGELTARTT
jgi:hypothetical protein